MNINANELLKAIETNIDKSKWVKWKFSDLVENIVEKVVPKECGLENYIGLKHLDTGSLKIRRYGKCSEISGDKLKIYKGDLIFAKRNSYLKRVAIADFDAVASAHSLVLRAKPENVSSEFLPFFLMSETFWIRAIEISVGSLSPTINWRVLAKQEFLLPPRDQQEELAHLFWSMNDVIEKELAVLDNVTTLRDINREKLYTYGIKAIDGQDVTKTKNGKSGIIREDFKEIKFFDCVEIKSGQVDPKDEKYSGLFQIGSERIDPNTGKINEFKSAKELKITSGNYLFTENDIIYSKIRPYFKKVAIPDFTGLCSADIYPLRLKSDSIIKEYLFYFMLTEKFTRKLLRFQNRTGMPKVNRDELSSMYIPYPDDESEQKEIVRIFKAIDSSLDSVNSKIEASKSLQKSLINQAF